EGDVEGVEFDGEGDDEGVESDGKGDLERVESIGEGDGGGVQVDGEGVSIIGIEVDEYGGVESGGQISLGSTVGKDNDSEVVVDEYAVDFATLDGVDNDADEYASDFATSDGVDNVAATSNGEKEDGNKTEDEHYFSVSFKNKMVTVAMIAQHFEATIKDHPKMKLREIQRRCVSKMHVTVTIDCSYRVKKIMKEKMARNYKEEFGLLRNYAHELRSNMPGSTIKMVVQRVTVDSLPHFKRPLIRLDDCFLNDPFKSEFFTVVERDANDQMFPIAWAVVEVECTDSWGLLIAISDILPRVEHRNCARHVFANWSGRKLGK
ncbi:hypothetical protein Goklo_023180, partial [Gossypium klotzschianum]|nr:hypothetical protein [Gossypium klotzschianum]